MGTQKEEGEGKWAGSQVGGRSLEGRREASGKERVNFPDPNVRDQTRMGFGDPALGLRGWVLVGRWKSAEEQRESRETGSKRGEDSFQRGKESRVPFSQKEASSSRDPPT